MKRLTNSMIIVMTLTVIGVILALNSIITVEDLLRPLLLGLTVVAVELTRYYVTAPKKC